MGKIESVIFDMDGVLFDTEKISYSFWENRLKKHGYVMNKEVYTSSIMGRNHKDSNSILIKMYGEDLPTEKLRDDKNIFELKFIHENGLPVKPGVYELLDFLVEKRYSVALATSTLKKRAVYLLDIARIRDKFTYIICGDDVISSKPNPEIFLKAAEKLGTNPKKCIVLEDSPAGIEAAHNARMMAINIPDLIAPNDKTEMLAYKICDSLLDVRDYLKSLI